MLWPQITIGILISFLHGWAYSQSLNLGQLIQLSIESHPSVRAQLSNQKAAQSSIETAEYQRYPTPQLSYESVKKDSADPSYIGSDGIATVRITQPIFTGGQFTAQLDKAKVTVGIAKDQENPKVTSMEIKPGMTASIDIRTGTRNLLTYLLKPVIKTLGTSLNER